jgi:putative SOS response-associated peptidase YedK
MCGRFVQAADPTWYAEVFAADAIETESLRPSYNVAPTDPVYAIAAYEGTRVLVSFRWGLLPAWAPDRKLAARTINARIETAAALPAFRDAFARKRCLIPADGFYEWQARPKGKLPHYIYRSDRRPFAFAGLWSSWSDPDSGERVRTCTILTGKPNTVVGAIHDRMPVVVPEGAWEAWLDPASPNPEGLASTFTPFDAGATALHPVSTLVNRVANNLPECIAPLTTGAADG